MLGFRFDFSRVQVTRGFAKEGVPKKLKTFWGRDIKPYA
jgi:hypothetical protein